MQILLILLLSTAISVFVVMVFYWLYHNSSEYCPKIKYKDFRKYYAQDPLKWSCYNNYVDYTLSNGHNTCFEFWFIGFYRYKLWQYKIDLADQRQRRTKSMQRFLDDINKTEAENG